MKPLPLIALADDFSGATEIAGVAHAAGLQVVLTRKGKLTIPEDAKALIIDTDTRRKSQNEAAQIHRNLAKQLHGKAAHFYKKTDSVLRGNILDELHSLLKELPYDQVLFCPANPARKRHIQDGKYTIAGTPLHKTEFGQDPNFPVSTDNVDQILKSRWSQPSSKFWTIPDVISKEDLTQTAQQITDQTLPAGASPFFNAFLHAYGLHTPTPHTPLKQDNRTTLLVSGSFSEVSRQTAAYFKKNNWPVTEIHPNKITTPLPNAYIALLKITEQPQPNPQLLLHKLASTLSQHQLPDHLLIEGGDTAATLLEKFNWHTFSILHQWEPGITTIKPQAPQSPILTIKPGSYPWPPKVVRHIRIIPSF